MHLGCQFYSFLFDTQPALSTYFLVIIHFLAAE